MAAANADLTKDIPALLESLYMNSTLRVKGYFQAASIATANPADTTAASNASALNTATATVTGVAVGDVVLGWGVVSGLATNQFIVGAFVSATDTVTFLVMNLVNTTVTTTAVTVNVLIADVT